MPSGNHPTNRLAESTSPYLQQHAHNPVDWYPWGEEALGLARRLRKPILLSIGYSACHWCHVMAHESFEDPETAELMNRLFVNIKVDREERPDLDKIYQTAHQLLARRPGGWPLTMFLTPDDQMPFFGGTYFPGEPRHGLPSFKQLLRRIASFLEENPEEVARQNEALAEAMCSLEPASPIERTQLDPGPIERARQQLEQSFDARKGGFGAAPKFPHPTSLERLLRHWAATASAGDGDTRALHMAAYSLRQMALGGVYDQLGGGFCRYAVDADWMIPHFEKMLYDNGPLLQLCADAWLITGQPLFRKAASETAHWVMSEMQSPEGGYYSTLDADSEGKEGKFYVWRNDEVRGLLDQGTYDLLARHFGLDREPNFEGAWHLHVFREIDALQKETGEEPEVLRSRIDEGRAALLRARQRRIPPGRDEKILTSWNALMIKGMARSARVLEDPLCLESACKALDFLRRTLWRKGRLLATYKDGRAHLDGYLDDYAFLLDALLEMLQLRWRNEDLAWAIELADSLLERFADTESGGFFFTARDHERLIHRPKPMADESTPSGNGVAAQALNKLGHLLGEPRYLRAVEDTLRAAWSSMEQTPYAHASLLASLEDLLNPPSTVVLRGEEPQLAAWQARLNRYYAPRRFAVAIPASQRGLPGALAQRAAPLSGVRAYVCRGSVCGNPVSSLEELDCVLREDEAVLPESFAGTL